MWFETVQRQHCRIPDPFGIKASALTSPDDHASFAHHSSSPEGGLPFRPLATQSDASCWCCRNVAIIVVNLARHNIFAQLKLQLLLKHVVEIREGTSGYLVEERIVAKDDPFDEL